MSESLAPQGIGYRGCLFLVILAVALLVLHGLFVYVQASVNEAKWREKGSHNYTMSISDISFMGFYGTLRVQNGNVVDAQPPQFSNDNYKHHTVDGLFEQIRSHAFRPFGWETVDYDPDCGYPKRVRFNEWSLFTDQPTGIDVNRLILDPTSRQ